MAFSYLKSIALFLLIGPLSVLALPVEPAAAARAVEKISALMERNSTHLIARQQNDPTGQIACTPTNNMHQCQLRSTQFPSGTAVMTVFDPWCDVMGVRVDKVQSIPGQYLAINCIGWGAVVEVSWWIPCWWWSPSSVYAGMQFGSEDNLNANSATGCMHCDRISWMFPFAC
ncbi:uncharacterized protein PAC_11590 [Phialocephala subalpina]|uniref:Uncharacterized protein n=1 Tax=Phialocephala subalpina TaxID=576137 RepID=A0A1L7X9J0_9HELO|nr:uncharacterized protein PAC_11590 [Phialocephala subalpina]